MSKKKKEKPGQDRVRDHQNDRRKVGGAKTKKYKLVEREMLCVGGSGMLHSTSATDDDLQGRSLARAERRRKARG